MTPALARAIRNESATALCYWFGVTGQTVSLWRKSLGVAETNEGTKRLRRRWWTEGGIGQAARAAAAGVTMSAEGRERIAASKRGVPRPRHVIEAMRRGRRGKPQSEEMRRKMRAGHQRRKAELDEIALLAGPRLRDFGERT